MTNWTEKTLRKAWLKALRSGKYKQGRNRLKGKNNTFCCLGVLCDVYDSSNWNPRNDGEDFITYNSHAASPPINICDLISLRNLGKLMIMNDEYGKSFSEIADYLENLWKEEKQNA